MSNHLKQFIPIAEATAKLLQPYAEVVIHDIKKDKIVAIFNSFSKRTAGDASLLGDDDEFSKHETIYGPYEKINWDGKKLKSISSVLRDDAGKIVGLFCINLDVSALEKCQSLIKLFLNTNEIQKNELGVLFKDDWREKINEYIHQYLSQNQLNLLSLTSQNKQKLIAHLHKHGAFEGKNAASYIAQVLNVSRATVYNYLQPKVNNRKLKKKR